VTPVCHGSILLPATLTGNVCFFADDGVPAAGHGSPHRARSYCQDHPGAKERQKGTPMTSQVTTEGRTGIWNRAARNPAAVAGISYSVAWIASLAVVAPNPHLNASGSQVVAAFAGHDWSAMAMFVLAEGVAAVALAVVVILVARATRGQRARRAGLTAAGFGLAAAVTSWAELAMGPWLVFGPVASGRAASAGVLYHALMRVDGAKMFMLAAMAVALAAVSVTSAVLPRWLAPLGLLLAVSIAVSGLGFVLLNQSLYNAVYVSGVLLLAVVTATGVTLRSGLVNGAPEGQ
jgi:hypothetical protein